MFRTKLDLELKQQIKSGSPFFNLRDSILVILKLSIDKPKVCIDSVTINLLKKRSIPGSSTLKNLYTYLHTRFLNPVHPERRVLQFPR